MYKTYFEQVYSEFWKIQSKKYGMEEVDKIIELLLALKPGTVFEVGIGTGWPIASTLAEGGAKVSGCDISENLVLETKQKYPQMELFAGNIWDTAIDGKTYDIVYCIRSSWYMEDFPKVIAKMLDMTSPDGYVIFNIINSANRENKIAKIKSLIHHFLYRAWGACKVFFFNKDFIAICPAYFYSMKEIEKVLNGMSYKVLSREQLENKQERFNKRSQKLLFIVKK